ncbi:hypothetical protein P4493_06070 [Bacillus thuringiensis]|uniref:Uncharacterized protein n=4 Tax=Bacillus thuringiensis TaxID=1428 RepID=A0AB33AQN6_BACTU|nr:MULTISPECIES: hypothetical protein [Bacillus]MEC2533130.1 hypothetical protein [Bacillus cereus]MED1153890.1 hypothetical protein [Bacillus paranthracis]AFQ30198.1 hypothetical protein BTF1_30487 [Bacillus thuringiensis HD-789]AJG74040.1 hypothetical protein BF38_6005 [Bacillus thuringiensis]AJH02693.1 hypothetical protein AS86_6352 [Bacillus thuringiensis HD1002]
MTLQTNQQVFVNIREGVILGYVQQVDGQNVYIRVGNDPYKFHVDQIIVINPDRYYLSKEILYRESMQDPNIKEKIIGIGHRTHERSNKQQTEKLIDDSGLQRKEQVFDKSTGHYNGGFYWTSRKGSTILRIMEKQLGVALQK